MMNKKYDQLGQLINKWGGRAQLLTNFSYFEKIEENAAHTYFGLIDLLKLSGNLLKHSNGVDGNGFRFWPVNELCRLSEYEHGRFYFSGSENYSIFCDYLDFSWAYAMSDLNGAVIMVGHSQKPDFFVANSLFSFIDLYLADDDAIYPG